MGDDWNWAERGWREEVGTEPERLWRESLRRAVDLRDQLATGGEVSTSRAVVLVDVLNALGDVSGYDSAELWSCT